jgi:hypothetical protein
MSLLNMRFQQSCQQMILVLGGHTRASGRGTVTTTS